MITCRLTGLSVLLGALLAACNLNTSGAPADSPDPTLAATSPGDQAQSFEIKDNLARAAHATASSSIVSQGPELLVDGRIGYENSWVAEQGPPQWIEVDLGGPARIEAIEMLVSQPRTAGTLHRIWGRASDGDYQLLGEVTGETNNHQVLRIDPDPPWSGIRYLRIETVKTPSLAAWQEIQIFGQLETSSVQEEDVATVVFHNGPVITMDDATGVVEALAIQGGRIAAVGTSQEMLALVGPETTVVDLDGRSLLPGFVDAHSHVFVHPESAGESNDSIQDRLLSEGITTITEMGVMKEEVLWLQERASNGELRLRVSLYMNLTDNCGQLTGDWYRAIPRSVDSGAMLQIPGLKAFADGGSCMAPAVTFEYPSGVGMGDLFFSQAEMESLISQAQQDGYQIAVHALGDRAIEQVLSAYVAVLGGEPNHMRHRIEHNAVVRPDMYPLYGQSGAVATLFGPFATCLTLGDPSRFLYRIPLEYQEWEWPYRDLMEANPEAAFGWHADVPVFELNPIRHLFGFVTRLDFRPDGSLCEPPEWLAAQTITVEQALKLMTINAAYALHRDHDVGSLIPGKLADLIVLSDNPLEMEPARLIELEVLATLVNGRTEFCQDGGSGVCP